MAPKALYIKVFGVSMDRARQGSSNETMKPMVAASDLGGRRKIFAFLTTRCFSETIGAESESSGCLGN